MHREFGPNEDLPYSNGKERLKIIVDLDDGVVAPLGLRKPRSSSGDIGGNAIDPQQVQKQITLRALSGMMLSPQRVFPIRPTAPHRYEGGQSPQ
jgi:hypothetical protein